MVSHAVEDVGIVGKSALLGEGRGADGVGGKGEGEGEKDCQELHVDGLVHCCTAKRHWKS